MKTEYVTTAVEHGSINISEEVLAVIAGSAALEIERSRLHSTPGRDIAGLLGRKNLAKGIRIHVDDRTVSADVYIMAAFGYAIGEVGTAVQKAVATAIESTTGLKVAAVNVHICGISFRKEK